jgi:hypothetical protein
MMSDRLNFMFKKYRQLDPNEQRELELLGSKLADLSAEMTIADGQKSRMKSNLFQAIENGETELPMDLCVLSKKVLDLSEGNYLSSRQKHLIWQELKSSVEDKVQEGVGALTWFLRNWRAGMASFLIGIISLGIFALAPLDLRLTRAAKWTFLESVSGKVFVNRNGQIFPVDRNFNLREGDLIFTGDDSFVTIRFLDDSVARLGADTSLAINKLYAKPDNSVSTQVEVSLTDGQIWASVYNLVDNDSRFVVQTDYATAKVNSKAAFEMKTDEQSTTLAVYDNVVDFSKKTSNVDLVQPVLSGYTAAVNKDNNFQLAYSDHDIVLQKNSDAIDRWAEMNLTLDQQHEEDLKQENSQFIDSAVANGSGAMGALAAFKDSTKALFDNTEIEQNRQKFLAAELGIIKAQQLILDANQSNDNRHQATPLLLQYKGVIRDILANYDNLKTKDAVQADLLIAEMQESVAAEGKSLSLVLPNEKLYTVKEVVSEASSYFAFNDAGQAEYLLAKAKNKLFEVESMINKNDLNGADIGFQVYLSDLDELVAQVNKANQAESGLFDLLEEQIKQFKVINAIHNKLAGGRDTQLADLVDKVNKISLNKLISIMQSYRKNGIPFGMLSDLHNTVESYFDLSRIKTYALSTLETMMKDYPEYAQMQQDDAPNLKNVSQVQGTIVDFSASQDIGVIPLEDAKQ